MKLSPAHLVRGRLNLPGDKSISHRAALIAALAEGPSEIANFSTARDCTSTLSCLQSLGIAIEQTSDKLKFAGKQRLATPREPLDCGNSGSTMRILAGVLAGHDLTATLIGDESLSSRPMRRIIEPLELMGAQIDATDGKPPLTIRGAATAKAITYKLPVASAQVKSAILFAGLKAAGTTTVIETFPSRDHTERLFNGFGVPVKTNDFAIELEGPAQFTGGSITIPGDISSAAFFIAAAMLLPGSDLVIENVGLNPTRAAFVNVLRSWGADISETDFRMERNEPVGTIRVRGGVNSAPREVDRVLGGATIPALIDELPLLAIVGTQIQGGMEIRDAAELRLKESDRLATTARNLRAMGAEVEETPDGLRVVSSTRFDDGRKLHGATIDSFGDHRIAMAFSVAALIADGDTDIRGSEAAAVSFPEFFELLDSIVER
ncbi:MAG TPA: 3-phosphoshikimate 1-carboxyvinyltransferase [Pyrinomonadaceae bacterium]|nr:3-phosphoshikimate 1-carboxyvinyltransferase [Pyrinomonadaceae bacterium]